MNGFLGIAARRVHERIRVWLLRRAVAQAVVNPNEKCPACGNRSGEIRWSALHEAVVHRCRVCGALWAEKPIVKAKAWKVELPGEELEGDDGLPYPFTRIPAKKEMTDGETQE
jgi:hypothetical protein